MALVLKEPRVFLVEHGGKEGPVPLSLHRIKEYEIFQVKVMKVNVADEGPHEDSELVFVPVGRYELGMGFIKSTLFPFYFKYIDS